MPRVRIEREGGRWWEIAVGYGKIQIARHIFTKNLPDAFKRAQIANPDADSVGLMKKLSAEEITEYNQLTGREVCAIALVAAYDMEKGADKQRYVDEDLPPDVADEVLSRVREAMDAALPPAIKKTSS